MPATNRIDHTTCSHEATRAARAACRKVRASSATTAHEAGVALLTSMRGDEFGLVERTCRALSDSRRCSRCNPGHYVDGPTHDDAGEPIPPIHTTPLACASALATLTPCTYCDSKGPWTAADIYRRNS